MRPRKHKNESEPESTSVIEVGSSKQLERIARLLALIATKELSQPDRILLLSAVGYSPTEIAKMLGTTPNTVSVTIYQETRKKKAKVKIK